MKRDTSSLLLFLSPALAYLFVWRVVPLLYTVFLSFTHWNLLDGKPPTWIGLANYTRLLADPAVFNSITITTLFMVYATCAEVVLGIGIAVLLDRRMKGIDLMKALYLAPMLITPVVVGTIWYILFHSQIGPLNYLLTVVGLPQVKWLDSPQTALYSIVIADIWQWTPFVVLLVLAALQTIPLEFYESADIDGASSFQRFRFITLPLIKTVVLVVAVLRAMDAFRAFDTVFIMTGGGPANATEVASVLVYRMAFQSFQIGYASAMVVFLLAMMSVFVWFYARSFRL